MQCNEQNGHVARNMKIILATIDMAAPYVNIYDIHLENKMVNFYWRVGGSVLVDKTFLMWDFYDDFQEKIKKAKISPMKKSNLGDSKV